MSELMDEPVRPGALPKPCPAALGAFGVPARRWSTRADVYSMLEKARDFLDSAPQGVRLRDVATIAGMSAYHFARTFNETYGASPAAYHRERLVLRAGQLLRDMSVGEVAVELGYRSASAFTRMYRAATGTTPSRDKKAP